ENQTLTITAVTTSNPQLIPNPTVNYTSPNTTGTLTFTPTANASGAATITVTVNDGANANNTAQVVFNITVNPVNDAPSFRKGTDQSANEDSGPQTVAAWAAGMSPGPSDEA